MECFLRMSVQQLVHLSFRYKCMCDEVLILSVINLPLINVVYILSFSSCYFVVPLFSDTSCEFLRLFTILLSICFFLTYISFSVCLFVCLSLSLFFNLSPMTVYPFSSAIITGLLLDLESSCKYGIQLGRKGYNNNYFKNYDLSFCFLP